MPKVSVIVPLYNAKKYVLPCVCALKRQGLADMEILLVDDCSPDGTYAYARDLFRDDAMVSVLEQEKNGGPGAARNKGMEIAKGEYICFCDVDDLYVDGAISEMLQEAERLEADVYCSNEFYFTVADPLPDDLSTLKEENLLKVGFISHEESLSEGRSGLAGSTQERVETWLRHRYHWSVFGKLFKRSFLREASIRFADVRLGEDQLFMLEALLKAMVYVDQVKSPYIYRAGSVSSVSRGRNPGIFIHFMRAILGSMDVIDAVLDELPFFDEHPEYRKKLKAFHIEMLESFYSIPKYHEIGREELSRNGELEALFTECFGKKGAFVEKTLFDAYDGRPAGESFEEIVRYENLKKLKDVTGSEMYSLLPE